MSSFKLKLREKLTSLQSASILSTVFLTSLLLIPLTALLWPYEFFFFRWNWIAFIFFPVVILFQNKISKETWIYFIFFSLYVFIFFINNGDFESLLRIFIALLPLMFIQEIGGQVDKKAIAIFWKAYLVVLCVPVALSVLQLVGKFPFYDSGEALWIVDEGRISGGYMKPNNLVTFIFPAFLFGINLLFERRYLKGISIVSVCYFIVLTSTLRIAIVIYTLILLFLLAPKFLPQLVMTYYRLYAPLLVGSFVFFALGWSLDLQGPITGLRERLPMWQAHAHHFMQADIWHILFGYSKVSLSEYYHRFREVKYFEEVHNNSFRIIITFGLIGFIFYCLLLRRSILLIRKMNTDRNQLFLSSAAIFYFMIYSLTNEPSFFAGISWCIMCWMLVGRIKSYV